jgi:MFS family permease
VTGIRGRLSESFQALGAVFRNRNMRRLEVAWAGSVAGEWSYGVALAVYAFGEGGALAVGVLSLARYIPAAIVGPFAALLADRFPRERVMVAADLIRAAALGAMVLLVTSGSSLPVYALAVLVAMVSTVFEPAQAALLPRLARTPEELTAANVASSTIETVGSFLGPAIGGLLLAVSSIEAAFAFTAAAFLWSALNVLGIRTGRVEPRSAAKAGEDATGIVHEAIAGFRVLARNADLRLLVGLYAAQTLVSGALNVLTVVVALDLLDLGVAGVGLLDSAVGIGGLVGAVVALALIGRRRLANDLGMGIVLWGIPIVLIGVWPELWFTLLMLGVLGIGNTIVDVAVLTLLQRGAPDDVLGRVFGVVEGIVLGTIGIGAALVSVVIDAFGIETALIVSGLFLPVLAALTWRRLLAIDARAVLPERRLALLRAIPIFGPLPVTTVEHLARSLRESGAEAGAQVIRQGDPGDDFYVIGSGEADVLVDGALTRTLGPGDYFGEIALLRDVPRTATVRARSVLELFALDRDEFIAGVTGHADSLSAADAVIGARLGQLRGRVGSL